MLIALLLAVSATPSDEKPKRPNYGDRRVCRPAPTDENPGLWKRTCKTVKEWAAYDRSREGWGNPQAGSSVGDPSNRTGAGINRTGDGARQHNYGGRSR